MFPSSNYIWETEILELSFSLLPYTHLAVKLCFMII